jgi:hypothetical protein
MVYFFLCVMDKTLSSSFILCSPCILAISFNSLTNECTFYFLTSIYPTYVSTYFGHHQGYTDIVTSLFTHSLGVNVEHYAIYNNLAIGVVNSIMFYVNT